ncbi:MAG: ArgE/DapE family deacylase [Gemmatimonadota bacterium]
MPSRFPLDPVALTEALVRIDSRNPSLVPGAPGERECAAFLASVLSGWGFAVALEEAAPGRPNVIARIGPTGRSPLVLNGHLDVVGTDGMLHEPFSAERRDGSIWGRGASDMKAGIAAMCVAAARASARGSLASEIIIAAVCDEEYESIGTRALLAGGLRATGAIVTEPTRMTICPAHKGFAWVEIALHGVAAHGSRYDIGVDAVRHAGLLLAALDRFESETLTGRTHPLLGRASLHAATIQGGTGWSTYAELCTLHVERRTLPGETAEGVMGEIETILDGLRAQRDSFRAESSLVCAQPPLDLALDAPLARAVIDGARAHGLSGEISGLPCWTDAALFDAAGIPALCFGPGDIGRAHSAQEWIECADIERAADVLEHICAAWGRD